MAGSITPAAAPVRCRPVQFGDGDVEVVRQQLHDPAPTCGCLATEVDEPSVVRLQAGPLAFEGGAVARHAAQVGEDVEERRQRVREDDLATHAIGVHLGEADVAVPVRGVADVDPRHDHAGEPRVELLVPARVEVGLVVGHRRARVRVRCHEHVASGWVRTSHGRPPPPTVAAEAFRRKPTARSPTGN